MKSSAPTQGTERPVGAGSCPTPGHRLPSPVPPPVCLALYGGRSRPPGRFAAARKGISKQGAAPLSRLTPTAPLAGEPFRRQFPKASPARGCGVERRLRRRKLFLMRQTAVTPFIIACSAIENIRPPFAHRSGLCRFATTQRSQSTSALQRAPCDADTANRTVDAPQGADGGVHCRLAAEIPGKARQGLAPHPQGTISTLRAGTSCFAL